MASGSLPGFQLDGPLCLRASCGERVTGESGPLPSSEATGVSFDATVLLVYVEGQPVAECPQARVGGCVEIPS